MPILVMMQPGTGKVNLFFALTASRQDGAGPYNPTQPGSYYALCDLTPFAPDPFRPTPLTTLG